MIGFTQLRNQLITYLSSDQVNEVEQAYQLADQAHSGQLRSSGDPYISHPLAVALILAQLNIDHQSIIAAILHDVIEDTHVNKSTLVAKFGQEVADIVDGVSKLALIKFESRAEAQAENLRKMILAMAKDIRVILVKLADRLHNMRTLDAVPEHKRRRVAKETLEIYAPIANRLGMNSFRKEFEDLGFKYYHPIRYRIINEAVGKARGNRKEVIHALEKTIKTRLDRDKITYSKIVGREKHLYSLYKKMQKKDLSLSEIMDVYALRIIVDKIDTCYRVLGLIHNLYKPILGRFKDYIAVPKVNGYQSLHTTVIGAYGMPIEIQIRTEAIDHMAENGIAAHWLYKSRASRTNEAEVRARQWLKGVLEIQENTGNSLEFVEHLKVDLYPDEVYIFTPKGDILSLVAGATCIDFAYAVHTDVGNTCIAAKVDRRLVPLSSRLGSGQTVEIISAEGAHPNPAWLSFVTSGKARSNIRNWLKSQQSIESQDLGQRLLGRALSVLNLEVEQISAQQFAKVLQELKLENFEQLSEEIGMGNQVAQLVARRLAVDLSKQELQISNISPLAIKGTEGMVVSYAKCCRPIPGDNIVGSLSAGRGIVVHREICNNVKDIQRMPEKCIFVQWAEKVKGFFTVELKLEIRHQKGNLACLANVLTESLAKIESVNIQDREGHHSSLLFHISISDLNHLMTIIRDLRDLEFVIRVSRAK